MSDTNVPQSTGGSGAGMAPMPSSGVPGSPPPASTGSFDPASVAGANANTVPEGAQYDMTGRMLNSAALIAQANPEMDEETCATLAVLAMRRTAANPLGYGDRQVGDGPITNRVKHRVKDLVSGDYQQRQRLRQQRPPARPGARPPLRGGAPAPAPAGAPAPAQPSAGDQLLGLVPLKPHERRLVDTIRSWVKKRRQQRGAPPVPSPNAPPIPAPPWVEEDDQEDIRRGEPLPPGVKPHDLNEDDQPGGRPAGEGESTPPAKAAVRHLADNPLDFGNRAPEPAGPLEQKTVKEIQQAEDTAGGFSSLPKPGEMPSIPGMGGGKSPKPGAAAAEADMAPMIAV